jgi:hypothetical protein
MVGLLQYWSPVLAFGLLAVWLNFVTGPSQVGAWLAWFDGIVALGALAATPYLHPSRPKIFRVRIPATISALLFTFWLIALLTRGPVALTWWTFFFAVAFASLALLSAFEGIGVVIRHPGTHQGDRPPWVSTPPPPSRVPAPSSEEIEEMYGSQIGGTDAYQPRGGYSQHVDRSHIFGIYWGAGPKGYLRSDIKIADEISEKLARRGDLDASQIEVDVREGDVTLRGTVKDRASRQLTEAICYSVLGVKDIHNELALAGEAA